MTIGDVNAMSKYEFRLINDLLRLVSTTNAKEMELKKKTSADQ